MVEKKISIFITEIATNEAMYRIKLKPSINARIVFFILKILFIVKPEK